MSVKALSSKSVKTLLTPVILLFAFDIELLLFKGAGLFELKCETIRVMTVRSVSLLKEGLQS